MNDSSDLFEAELKRLRPRIPSAELLTRIGRELDPAAAVAPGASHSPHLWARLRWLAVPLAAAAALALAALWGWRTRSTTPPVFKPVAATELLYASSDEGEVTLPGGIQARRVRDQYVDTYTWQDPRTRASLQWTVPREEVRVVPIQFY